MGLIGYEDPQYGRIAKVDAKSGTAVADLTDGRHISIPFEIVKHTAELAVGQRVRVRFDQEQAVKGIELENLPLSQVSTSTKVHHLQLQRTGAIAAAMNRDRVVKGRSWR